MTKMCSRCRVTKPTSAFAKNSGARDGLRSSCKDCDTLRYQRRKSENPDKVRESWRRASARYSDRGLARWKKYGLLPEDYNALVDAQERRCRICGTETTDLVVDHCHTTGYVRALLCSRCNTGLGMFGESVERLGAAIEYLRSVEPTPYRASARQRTRSNAAPSTPRCIDCGGRCSVNASRCRDCHVLHQYASRATRIDWPPAADLAAMVAETSYVEVGRRLGVTDNAVRKHIATERRAAQVAAG